MKRLNIWVCTFTCMYDCMCVCVCLEKESSFSPLFFLFSVPPPSLLFLLSSVPPREDILWWLVFAKLWNGISIYPAVSSPQVFLTSDASGAWGCGAFTEREWFQLQWTPQHGLNEQIMFKERLPIVLSVMTWGRHWRGCHLHCNCDNEAVVHL